MIKWFIIIIKLQPTYKNLLDLVWLSRFLFLGANFCQQVTVFKTLGSYPRIFTAAQWQWVLIWFTSWKCIHIFAGPTHGKPSQVVKGDYIARSGYVLIINNHPTPTASDPFKSEKTAFAEVFGFTTREDINLTTSDMLKALTDTAQRDFSNNDCFCCIIRSTGSEHGICGTDDKPIDIKTITSLFTSDKCPSLDGKPKIFVLIPKKFEYQSPVFRGLLGYTQLLSPEDIEARSMLRHLVISEKDFLVWNRFGQEGSFHHHLYGSIFGTDWLKYLSRGMHLTEAIATATVGIIEPSSLLSTLEKNVFFKRNDSS